MKKDSIRQFKQSKQKRHVALHFFQRCKNASKDKRREREITAAVQTEQISNPCPSTSDEEIAESEDLEENKADIKAKKSKGRKSLSAINNLARKRIIIDLTDEEKNI